MSTRAAARTRLRPTRLFYGLLFGALVLFGVGTNVQAGWLIVLTALILGAVFTGLVLPPMALRGIEVTREAPETATAGRPVRIAVKVSNTSRSLRGLVLVRDSFLGEATMVVTRLWPGRDRSYVGERSGDRRGLHTSGPVEIVSGAPFGVAIARRTFDIESTTLVYPRVVEVPPASLPGHSVEGEALTRRAPVGDAAGIREYRPGDPVRHIHWRSSARRTSLVVREFEEEAGADVAIVADTSAGGDVLEAVAAACASYAVAALGTGRRVQLVWARDGAMRTAVADGRRQVLEWAALLEAPGGLSVAELLSSLPDADGVVCACGDHEGGGAGALGEIARAGTGVLALLVRDADSGRDIAATENMLRAAGARVLVLPPTDDLEPWLSGAVS